MVNSNHLRFSISLAEEVVHHISRSEDAPRLKKIRVLLQRRSQAFQYLHEEGTTLPSQMVHHRLCLLRQTISR